MIMSKVALFEFKQNRIVLLGEQIYGVLKIIKQFEQVSY